MSTQRHYLLEVPPVLRGQCHQYQTCVLFFICRSCMISVQCLKYSVAEILSKDPCCYPLERSDLALMEVPLPNWSAGIPTPKPVMSWHSHSGTCFCLTALLSLARALTWLHKVVRPKPTNNRAVIKTFPQGAWDSFLLLISMHIETSLPRIYASNKKPKPCEWEKTTSVMGRDVRWMLIPWQPWDLWDPRDAVCHECSGCLGHGSRRAAPLTLSAAVSRVQGLSALLS